MSEAELVDFRPPRPSHWLTRTLVLRLLGLVYIAAFATLVFQFEPLLGRNGLLPVDLYLSSERGFWDLPSLFWFHHGNRFMLVCAWLGLAGGVAVLAGVTNALLMAALWALYLSFVHVGQDFYGYGWELLLLEAGFLAIFLCPLSDHRSFSRRHPPPEVVIWLYRWLAFRVVLGAGLIKVRGDPCWRDLTCLQFHYETQPNPHPLSWLLHQMPPAFHTGGVLFNHVVELLAPMAALAPRPYRTIAGILLVAFQISLILSGNLSFLNWLTLAVCLSCFDDEPLLRAVPPRFRARLQALIPEKAEAWAKRRYVLGALAVVIGVLSLNPVVNMLSPRQAMNRSFDPFELVNTYGAFGSVDRERFELVIQGSDDGQDWKDYEFPCKPGDVMRRPCLVTPYHHRLDWELWWPFNDRGPRPYLVHLVHKLLTGDPMARRLLASDPFHGRAPRWIRIEQYRYRFTRFGEEGWWRRERVDAYMVPVSRDDPNLAAALKQYGF